MPASRDVDSRRPGHGSADRLAGKIEVDGIAAASPSHFLRLETEAEAGRLIDDVREVFNYVDTLMHGLERPEALTLS